MQKGASIYIAVVVTSVVLGIALGISTLLFGELRLLRGVGFSVIALSAADAGIEHAEYLARAPQTSGGCGDTTTVADLISCLQGKAISGTLGNGATYSVEILSSAQDAACTNYCADSTGEHKEAKRKARAIR